MLTNYGELQIDIDDRTGRATLLNRPLKPHEGIVPTVSVVPGPHPRVSPDPDSPRYRSKLEARYADYLEARRHTGEIRQARYEALRLKLAPNTTLTPDFFVEMPDRTVEIHEVKGFTREDAWIKLKMAAALWPWFGWCLVTRRQGEWIITRVPSA